MALVQVDDRHRLTLPKEVRGRFKVAKGQKFYIVSMGDDLVMKPVPKDPSEKLSSLIGDFRFDRKARKEAEKWLLESTKTKPLKKKKTL
jgi:bifunctional DNA-binding transcriptional regulator/antitoxin component of YhaV-PrlF toxin-antitoxin module